MIQLPADEADAAEFLSRIEAMACGICRLHRPNELVVTRIDNWFGPNWRRFSGKVLGLAGFWKKKLTLPPFVPSRVVWQRRYKVDGSGDGQLTLASPPLHVRQTTSRNFKRHPQDIAPEAALLWFSSRTADSGRGAAMAYIPTATGYLTWYVGFVEKDTWQAQTLNGISRQELEHLNQQDIAAATRS